LGCSLQYRVYRQSREEVEVAQVAGFLGVGGAVTRFASGRVGYEGMQG
jgi:hypothetical protein